RVGTRKPFRHWNEGGEIPPRGRGAGRAPRALDEKSGGLAALAPFYFIRAERENNPKNFPQREFRGGGEAGRPARPPGGLKSVTHDELPDHVCQGGRIFS